MIEINGRISVRSEPFAYLAGDMIAMSIVSRSASAAIVIRVTFLAACLSSQSRLAFPQSSIVSQTVESAKVELGSKTAKDGFHNEDEIRNKFDHWVTDGDARGWLAAMNHDPTEIESVTTSKPHGEKADVEVTVRTKAGETLDRISIKLVSSPHGFNQIDKRWLATYAAMWNMPPDVIAALSRYVGETPPKSQSRDGKRMYLDELDEKTQASVVDFFTTHKDQIVSDVLAGDGDHAADWVMVTFKATNDPKWVIRSSFDAIKYFGSGDVRITREGNLKIGHITMQRKGGDNGRSTANMLQFKINPIELFKVETSLPEQ